MQGIMNLLVGIAVICIGIGFLLFSQRVQKFMEAQNEFNKALNEVVQETTHSHGAD